MVLYDGDGGRLFLLNHSAHHLWRMVRGGFAGHELIQSLARQYGIEPPVARRDVERFFELLEAADLLRGDAADAGAATSSEPVPRSTPPLDRCYRIGDLATRVICHAAEVAPSFAALAAPALAAGSIEAESALTLFRRDDVFYLLRDGRLLQRLPTAPLARWALVRELVRGGRLRSWLALLHAGALATPEGALLVAGDSGAGKSTLLAGLMARGLPFISDDIAPIEAGTGRVWPVPLALSVKQGSWSVVEQLFPQLARQPAIPFGTRIMRYLLPPTPAADAGHSIARVLFPRYVEGAPVAVEHLDPTASLVRLGEGGSVLPDTDEGLAAFLALWARTPAYQITYGRLDEAVAAILERVDQTQQRRVGAIAGTADAPV